MDEFTGPVIGIVGGRKLTAMAVQLPSLTLRVKRASAKESTQR
jgi:hypothetical protein